MLHLLNNTYFRSFMIFLQPMCIQDAPEITKRALDASDAVAVETVDLFLAILGQEAGANGLRILAQGGVYLCGGILPRVSLISQ